jgi:hypothetical protein
VPVQSVETRHAAIASGGAVPEAQRVTLGPGVAAGLRILAAPQIGSSGFFGEGRVTEAAGERVALDLPGAGSLVFLARAGGEPLRLAVGETVRVEYRGRFGPLDREEIVAVRSGPAGIVSVLETGKIPVAVSVRLFNLVAHQVGESVGGVMDVELRVADSVARMPPGTMRDTGGLRIALRASTGSPTADKRKSEGNPYAINLVAWTQP